MVNIEKFAYDLTLMKAKSFSCNNSLMSKPGNTEINTLIETYNYYLDELSKRAGEFHSIDS